MVTASAPRSRDKRLETRLTPAQKELIERAAAVQGRTVSDFVATTLQEAAKRAIEESTVWELSQDQQKAFIDALLNPPAANKELKAAWNRYQTRNGVGMRGDR